MENWTEIKINVPVERVDEAGSIASMTVPYGIYIEDYSNLEEEAMEIAKIDLIDEELKSRDRSIAYIHIYVSPEENPFEAVAPIHPFDWKTRQSIHRPLNYNPKTTPDMPMPHSCVCF